MYLIDLIYHPKAGLCGIFDRIYCIFYGAFLVFGIVYLRVGGEDGPGADGKVLRQVCVVFWIAYLVFLMADFVF